MKKILLILIAIILDLQVDAKVNLDTIISQITKVQLRRNPTDTVKLIKTKVNFANYVPVNQKCDTVFIEEVEYAERGPSLRVWNKKNFVSYDLYNLNDTIISEEPGYIDLIIDRINNWDIEWLTKFWQNTKMIIKGDFGDTTMTRIIIRNGFATFETITYAQPFVDHPIYNGENKKYRRYK